MLKLVGLGEDLVQITVEEIISGGGRDFSRISVVTPSQRMLFFIRDQLNARLNGSYFPPELVTIDNFIFRIFTQHYSGFRMAYEMESALMIFKAIKQLFKDQVYTGGRAISSFVDFFPWALIILKAIEELLIEGKFIDRVDQETFGEFASLGDYHRDYKDFIGKMPLVMEQFKDSLLKNRRYSRGIAYRMTADLAEAGEIETPARKKTIFSGLGAPNTCEEKILKFFLENRSARLLVRCDPKALDSRESPFFLLGKWLKTLNLLGRPDHNGNPDWNQLSGRVSFYCLPNLESQMVQVGAIVNDRLDPERRPEDLKKIAVILPDPASLIPFIHGVVSRSPRHSEKIPFNLSLGYPFQRTPLYQLLIFMMKVVESTSENGKVFSPDYLNLIRHPYVKLSGSTDDDEEPLKRGIHLIEDLLTQENVLYFVPKDLEDRISQILEDSSEYSIELKNEICAEIKNLHMTFLSSATASLLELVEFLKRAVLAVGKNKKYHLLLEDYTNTAVNALDQIIRFAGEYESDINQADFKSMVSLLSYHFSGVHIYFEGSPLKGIQVMGMLESRGLLFDEVIVIDAQEGILPQLLKYDPLLPYDIRKAFGVRDYSQWETLFAYHFFSLLGGVKKIHLLWIDGPEGPGRLEKSRFVERIIYEIEKQGHPHPAIIRKNCRCELEFEELKTVSKSDGIRAKIRRMCFSASSLEEYIRCPLRFYFSHIVGLEERIALSPDPDTGELGSLVHGILDRYYREGRAERGSEKLEKRLYHLVEEEFNRKGFSTASGTSKIRCWVMVEKLKDFLLTDFLRIEEKKIRIIGFEQKVTMDLELPFSDSPISFRGRIDRIEQEGEMVRLIDYKTGTPFSPRIREKAIDFRLKSLKDLEKLGWLTSLKELQHSYASFQLLLYALMTNFPSDDYSKLDAAYIFLKPPEDFFKPVFVGNSQEKGLSIGEKNTLMQNFKHNLVEIMADIFQRETFEANDQDRHYCQHCPFRIPCGNI